MHFWQQQRTNLRQEIMNFVAAAALFELALMYLSAASTMTLNNRKIAVIKDPNATVPMWCLKNKQILFPVCPDETFL